MLSCCRLITSLNGTVTSEVLDGYLLGHLELKQLKLVAKFRVTGSIALIHPISNSANWWTQWTWFCLLPTTRSWTRYNTFQSRIWQSIKLFSYVWLYFSSDFFSTESLYCSLGKRQVENPRHARLSWDSPGQGKCSNHEQCKGLFYVASVN